MNDHLFDCVERLSTSFVNALEMNSYMCSCLSIEPSSGNWGDHNKDGREIDRAVSLFVVKCDEQQDEWRFVTETKELNTRLDNLKLP